MTHGRNLAFSRRPWGARNSTRGILAACCASEGESTKARGDEALANLIHAAEIGRTVTLRATVPCVTAGQRRKLGCLCRSDFTTTIEAKGLSEDLPPAPTCVRNHITLNGDACYCRD